MEAAYTTLIIKITNKEAIEDAGATVNFVRPGTPVNNVQPASKPITINLPNGYKLRSTHTCSIDI